MVDRPPDYWGKRERAEEAQSLLGSPIFGMAVARLRAEYIDQMIACQPGDVNLALVHAKLKIIDEVIGQLKSYVDDEKFKQRERE
jgi:hypothetical protein